ncbi:MAG: BMP family ABC transporter substrate-binding protein [Deltaproteobacteria bacterium]|nr:BMP family ABC transporter substrate-binding protein [Deltaproteobacteria bacterium]
MKIFRFHLLLIVAVVLAFTGTTVFGKDVKDLKAAFVYVGPIGDGGWTYSHDLGRKHLEELGVKTSYIETVPETDSIRVIRNFARQNYDIIFTTSFGYMDPTLTVASESPKTTFMHCSGFKTAENVGTYFGRIYQAKFLTGMVAGYMTKSNVIGVIGSHPIPEIIRHINAFALGVRAVNPDAKVKVIWVNAWFDPSKEGAAADSLMDDGADIVSITTDSAAALKAAEKRKKYAIGNNSDITLYAPSAHLTSAVWNWGVYYEHIAKQVAEGTWKTNKDWWGIESGIADISSFGDMVPADVRDKVNKKKEEIIAGKSFVFEGPFNKQDGSPAVKKGEKLTDEQIWGIDYFVEGVVGALPKK